jgi:hypothetical protein
MWWFKQAYGSMAHVASSAAATGGAVTMVRSSTVPTERSFSGDGDGDNPSDIDGDEQTDADDDDDDDSQTEESKNYHDHDDGGILNYGQAAGAADRQAVTAIVKPYYAALAGAPVSHCPPRCHHWSNSPVAVPLT